jgi:hypothetical protein
MACLDAFRAGEGGHGLGDATRPRAPPTRKRQPFDRAIEELCRLRRPAVPPGLDAGTSLDDASANGRGRLGRPGRELVRARTRHRNDEVEAIEQSP